MNSSLHTYHIFYTAAKYGSISTAAKKLYISQPAVSKAVARLEQTLGTQLLVRTSRGVTLTEAGEILYRQLSTAFHAIQAGEDRIQSMEEGEAGKLSIGVSTTLCKFVLLPHLRAFLGDNPHVRLSINCQSTYETIAALENGSLDIGLIGETEKMGSLEFISLMTIHDIFAGTRDYVDQLTARSEENPFTHATLLLLNQNNITRQYVEKYMIYQNITGEQQIDVTTMDLLIDFAKLGLGLACVIREFVESELTEGTLVQLDTKVPIPPRCIGFAYSRSSRMTKTMQSFLDMSGKYS